ncbi:hypothetical protein ACWDTD_19930 [Gordonia sp. NPDC003425]
MATDLIRRALDSVTDWPFLSALYLDWDDPLVVVTDVGDVSLDGLAALALDTSRDLAHMKSLEILRAHRGCVIVFSHESGDAYVASNIRLELLAALELADRPQNPLTDEVTWRGASLALARLWSRNPGYVVASFDVFRTRMVRAVGARRTPRSQSAVPAEQLSIPACSRIAVRRADVGALGPRARTSMSIASGVAQRLNTAGYSPQWYIMVSLRRFLGRSVAAHGNYVGTFGIGNTELADRDQATRIKRHHVDSGAVLMFFVVRSAVSALRGCVGYVLGRRGVSADAASLPTPDSGDYVVTWSDGGVRSRTRFDSVKWATTETDLHPMIFVVVTSPSGRVNAVTLSWIGDSCCIAVISGSEAIDGNELSSAIVAEIEGREGI